MIIEDVTLKNLYPELRVSVNIRFKGGATRSLSIPRASNHKDGNLTPPEVIRIVREMAPHYRDAEIAQRLNEMGLASPSRKLFTRWMVRGVRLNHVGYRRDTGEQIKLRRRARSQVTPASAEMNMQGAV